MRYFISDMHFYHESLNHQMDKRGFATLEEMHEYMISQWNKKVRRGDDVVILGDFSLGKGVVTNEILRRLNGAKYLIEGNHDKFLNDKKFDRTLLRWIKPYEEIKDNKRKVVLSHYPIMCYNGQNRLDSEGNPKSYMLYGHVHDTFDQVLMDRFIDQTRQALRPMGDDKYKPIPCHMINCFCMYSDYMPLSLDEWIELDKARREKLEKNLEEKGRDTGIYEREDNTLDKE